MPETIPSALINIMALLLVMFLVKLVRSRDRKAEQARLNLRPGGITTSGRIILADTNLPSPESIRSTLKELWKITPGAIATTGSRNTLVHSFALDWANILVTLEKQPLPIAAFQGVSPSNALWENAVSDLQSHQAFITVEIMSEHLSVAQRSVLFTHVAATLALRTNAVAVHLPATQLLFHPNFYIEAAIQADAGEYFPVQLWVELFITETPSGRINAYTKGLEELGRKELEVYSSASESTIIQQALFYVAHYSIMNNAGLQHDQLLALSENIEVAIRESDSFVIGRNPVYRLEI